MFPADLGHIDLLLTHYPYKTGLVLNAILEAGQGEHPFETCSVCGNFLNTDLIPFKDGVCKHDWDPSLHDESEDQPSSKPEASTP